MATSKNVVQFNTQRNRKGRPETAPVFQSPQNGAECPLRMIAQQIPRLTKKEIWALAETLIDAVDDMDPDCDLEDDDREAEQFM
jgi:hypothetical protein